MAGAFIGVSGHADGAYIYDGDAWVFEQLDNLGARAIHVTATDAWAVGYGGSIAHRAR